ncbi:trypsin-like isoform X1 [Neodiprion virginianus]|uniref:trypsin-like isoform X1 n=1 Tax=Neodiprion virginianus TaxID=2961670 RepID=UPI001EE69CE2|nr:trypsin-like isoform X1 [Neodiprion virginianus]
MLRYFTLVSLLALCRGFESITTFPEGSVEPLPLKTNDAPKSRIVGGQTTTIANYPWAVSLQHEWEEYTYDTIHFCTGTIINKDWILATGVCALMIESENVTIRVGSDYFHEGGTVHEIEYAIFHPEFNETTQDYDLALLRLNTSLTLSNSVQAVKLPSLNQNYPEGTIFSMASWGASVFLGDMTTQLQYISLPTITTELCQTVYFDRITDRMFCSYEEYVGMCIGDTGAAAVVDGVLIGIASWDYACSSYGYPGVYANVSVMVDWITEVSSSSSPAPLFCLVAGLAILLRSEA